MRIIYFLSSVSLFWDLAAVKPEYFSPHDLCEQEIIKYEKRYAIPNRLLMAISTVESGRQLNDSKTKRPWPWCICANGKSYYLSTKSAAIAAVKKLRARGIKNIDVGCMQVNLFHHSKAFKNLEEAFTPKNNVAYASKLLCKLKQDYGSWTHAVGYYHSKNSKYYKPYCSNVYTVWNKVKERNIITPPARAQLASAEIKSKISFLPSYYSLIDNNISSKLHRLGKMSLMRKAPKFFRGTSRSEPDGRKSEPDRYKTLEVGAG